MGIILNAKYSSGRRHLLGCNETKATSRASHTVTRSRSRVPGCAARSAGCEGQECHGGWITEALSAGSLPFDRRQDAPALSSGLSWRKAWTERPFALGCIIVGRIQHPFAPGRQDISRFGSSPTCHVGVICPNSLSSNCQPDANHRRGSLRNQPARAGSGSWARTVSCCSLR